MDYGIFNVHRDVNACECTRRVTATVRQPALKVDSGRKKKKNLAAPGNRTCVAACRSDALPLSYIAAPFKTESLILM